jgi:hypothetical protein
MVDEKAIKSKLANHFNVKGTFVVDPVTGVVDVDGDVQLTSKIPRLGLQFGVVTGDFVCSHTQLKSLEGSPRETGKDFRCRDNLLSSLKGAPSKTGGRFDCGFNKLTTLEGSPQQVFGSFDCDSNQLENLKGMPSKIGKDLWCVENPLTSLEGLPTLLLSVTLTYRAELPLLRLLAVPQIILTSSEDGDDTSFDHTQIISKLLRKYVGTGRKGAFSAAREIISAGEQIQKNDALDHNPFERNARW